MSIRTLSTIAVGITGIGSFYYLNKPPATVQPTHYDHRPFTLLEPDEIQNRLLSGQLVNKLNLSHVKAVYTNQLPSNNPVEDNYSINTFKNSLIAGVYDGHIGPECSRLIKKQLPIYLARQVNQTDTISTAISQAFTLLDNDIQQRFYNLFPKTIRGTEEKDIREAIARDPNHEEIINQAIHGSCACAVYIKEDVVYSANTGDSRIVIVSQDEDGKWKGRRLVEEETPARPLWKQHMLSTHPPEEAETTIIRNRIFGCLAVGGAFGDIMYKVPVEYQMKVLPYIPYDIYKTFARYHHRIVVHYKTPPYLVAEPLVERHQIDKNDRFIILASDGLWDELCWDDVHSPEGDQVAADIMSKWKPGQSNPATHLLREALLYEVVYKNIGKREDSQDDTLELSKRLTRKPSRSYRDDITITIIELNQSQPLLENMGPILEPSEVDMNQPRLFTGKSNSGIWSRL